jgi:formate dehydrogenase major subunit
LWGSNARAAHPIFFHHVLKGIHNGAAMIVVDPRRTESAEWGDLWLGIDVGTDIALSNTIAREIIVKDLQHHAFVEHATTGFEEYRASVMDWTLERGEAVTGVPAEIIQEVAHAYAKADRAVICWTLGITEHHNAVDNVLSLINLSLLTGHVGVYGSGLNPLRGQNNVQGGGDMGAIPNKLPGFQDIEKDAAAREKFERAWGVPITPKYGWHLTQMFHAMERGEMRAVYVIGENPASSEADATHATPLLENLDCLIVQDIFMTKTAELADVVLPASAAWAESEGTVTNSERRVQRVRKALDPPGDAKDDIWIIAQLAKRLGVDWGDVAPRDAWEELRTLSPMHAGMSYEHLEALGGIQWPCPDESHPGTLFLHARLWEFDDPETQGTKAPFSVVIDDPPVDVLDAEFPLRLTTGRRLDSYNTGVQTGGYTSPLRRPESIEISPEDARHLGVEEGERVRVTSRRGSVEAPVHIDHGLRPGLTFMTPHFPDEVETNRLTIEANDPKSGTAEFKATAVRIDRLTRVPAAAGTLDAE